MLRGTKDIFKRKSTTIIMAIAFGCLFLTTVANSYAACDCGSVDSENPCTGRSIVITVNSTAVNGANSQKATFSWSFNSGGGDARCGQFANGDYWIAPAAGQSTVTITGIRGSDSISADADPVMESMGLLDGSESYGNHNASENIIPTLPKTYSANTSLVAAIQRDEAATGNCGTSAIVGECVDAYHVVTVLDKVPANAGSDMIRPNITGEIKEFLTLSDFDFSRLPAKKYLTGTDAAGYEAMRQRWSHSTEIFGIVPDRLFSYSEGGRAFRSHILIDDYGGGMARQWNDDMMVLFSDDNTLPEKQAALAAMLSFGLDLYHDMYDRPSGVTRYWGQGATQHPGRFLPAVFMAALLKDTAYASNLKTVGPSVNGSKQDIIGPHELGQVHDGSIGPVWGDFINRTGVNYLGAYWVNLHVSQCYDGASGNCNTNYGKKTQLDPHGYIDGPANRPGSGYMPLSLGLQRSMVATMFLMPEICEIINYDLLIEYVDRIENYGLRTANDPCVTPDTREDPDTCDAYRNKNCQYYGVTWGPVDPTDMDSDCIKTPTPPYTKVGRFTELDGTAVHASYTSFQVERNWSTIRGTNDSCRASQPSGISAPSSLRAIDN